MAILKDSLVQGSMRVTDTLYADTIQGTNLNASLLDSETIESTLLKIYSPNSNAASATQGINFYTTNVYKGHIGSSDAIGVYSVGQIFIRPSNGSVSSNYGITFDYQSITPKTTYNGTAPVSLGTTDLRWNGVYSSTGDFTGTVTISKSQEASGTANNSPALIVGGAATSAHLELDGNEIMAKASGTTVGPLYLNNDGGTVQVGKGGFIAGNATAGVEVDVKAISNAGQIYLYSAATATGNRGIYGYNAQGTGNPILTVNQDSMITGGGTIKWYYTLSSTNRYIGHYLKSKNNILVGETWYDVGDNDNITAGIWNWRAYSPNNPNTTTTTGKYITYYLPPVDTGLSANKTVRILTTKNDLDLSGLGQFTLSNGMNIDTDCIAPGTYNSSSSSVSGTLTGTVFSTGAGFKLHNIVGYRAKTLRQFGGAADNRLFYRSTQDTGTTWTKWYQFVLLPSGSDNKTFSAIGGTTTPIYVDASGIITAGTQIKALAYKDSLAASDIPTISITDKTSGTLTVARGGTGAATFTADCAIVGNGTNAMASRGLKITGATNENVTIQPYTSGKDLDIYTNNSQLTIQGGGNSGHVQINSQDIEITNLTSTGQVTLNSAGTMTATSTGIMTISASNTFYLDAGANTSHIFRKGTTECVRINTKGMLQVNSSVTQSSHKLLVNGDSAFTGKLSFVATPANTLTENAYIQYLNGAIQLSAKAINFPTITGGTGVTASDLGASVNPRYRPASWKYNAGIAPIDGDIVTIKIPSAAHDYGTWLSLDNGTTYHPVIHSNGLRLQNWFSNNMSITLRYDSVATCSMYGAVSGTSIIASNARETITGCWRLMTQYDTNTNTLVRTYALTNNSEYPLIAGMTNTTGSVPSYTSSYANLYGIVPGGTNGTTKWVTINASTGLLSTPAGINVKGYLQLINSSGTAFGQMYSTSTDAANTYANALNNIVISSWWGVSFTTHCSGQACSGVNAVSIDCRTGNIYAGALTVQGTNGNICIDNGHLIAGNTAPNREIDVSARSSAGQIYLYSDGANSTKHRGIWVTNTSGTGASVLRINQANFINDLGQIDIVTAGGWAEARDKACIKCATAPQTSQAYRPWFSGKTLNGNWSIGHLCDQESFIFAYTTDTNYTAYVGGNVNANLANASVRIAADGGIYGAVWNDYAEYRKQLYKVEPGRVVYDLDDGYILPTDKRLIPGAQVVSDTFGFIIGETDECKTPLAVAGRVLVYTYRDRYEYHAGDAVCSAPDGTVDIMTREEIKEYPDAIIGIVSEIPHYKTWGTSNVPVNGRIWIKVR